MKIGMVVFHYCKDILSVLETEWICLSWSMLLLLEEHCSGRPSHSIAAGAASLCPHATGSTPWKAAPIHTENCSPCILWASFDQPFNDWMLKSMAATFLKAYLTFLIVDACAGRVSPWVVFKTSTICITVLKTCSPCTSFFVTLPWDDLLGPCVFPELRANQPDQWELSASVKFRGAGCTKPHHVVCSAGGNTLLYLKY